MFKENKLPASRERVGFLPAVVSQNLENIENLPGYLRIQLVDFCNEDCFFCHNEGTLVKKKKIDEKILWNAIEASFDLGKKQIKFTGGEPTLHPNFVSYILNLREKKPDSKIGFTSNGTTLKKLPKQIFKTIDELTISLHSLNREKYKQITGKDYLKIVLDGLELVRSYDFRNVSLNYLVTKKNITELKNMIDYCAERGFNLKILDLIGDEEENIPMAEIKKEVNKLIPKESKFIKFKPKNYYQKCQNCDEKQTCGEGDYLRLTVEGKLVPCLFRSDLEQTINPLDSYKNIKKKVALGFRRIVFDDL